MMFENFFNFLGNLKRLKIKNLIKRNLIEYNSNNKNVDFFNFFVLEDLKLKSLVESINIGLNKSCLFYILFSEKIFHIDYLKLVADITSVFGVHLLIVNKQNYIKIFENNISFLSKQISLKFKSNFVDNNKIGYVFVEEIENPAFLMSSKLKEYDIVFLNSEEENLGKIISDVLITYAFNGKAIFAPSILNIEDKLISRQNRVISVNTKFLRKIRTNFASHNLYFIKEIDKLLEEQKK